MTHNLAHRESQLRLEHWQTIWSTREDEQMSWFQDSPAVSVDLIFRHAGGGRRIIDIGGGSSGLAGELLHRGYRDITVLDIAPAAVERGRARLGGNQERVKWIVADVLTVKELDAYDIWHDRAVFHFLQTEADRARYIELAARSLERGGYLILGTFAPNGPDRCSGLPVQRYDAESIETVFGRKFALIGDTTEIHMTPSGKEQFFTWTVLCRMRSSSACG